MAAFGAAQAQLFFPDVAKGQGASQRVFTLLDRVPAIDAASLEGAQPLSVRGDVELRDVTFAYPMRPEVKVFRHFDLVVPAGKTVALVGESGSGKSTVIGLIERFYDPLGGQVGWWGVGGWWGLVERVGVGGSLGGAGLSLPSSARLLLLLRGKAHASAPPPSTPPPTPSPPPTLQVLLDGQDIRTLNLHWLRDRIALVSQEPVLFSMTVAGGCEWVGGWVDPWVGGKACVCSGGG